MVYRHICKDELTPDGGNSTEIVHGLCLYVSKIRTQYNRIFRIYSKCYLEGMFRDYVSISCHSLRDVFGTRGKMAEWDLTSTMGQYLDRHLVFPLLEFLSERNVS